MQAVYWFFIFLMRTELRSSRSSITYPCRETPGDVSRALVNNHSHYLNPCPALIDCNIRVY